MEVCDRHSSLIKHVAMATGILRSYPTLGEPLSMFFCTMLKLANADMMNSGCSDSFTLDAIRIGRLLSPRRPVAVAVLPLRWQTAAATAGERSQ